MPWLSLPDYARRTGTPESTVRAAIRSGKLRAELEQRAPGDPRTVWRVWLDDPQEQPQNDPRPSSEPRMPSESPQPQPAATEPPVFTTRLLEMVEADRETIAGLHAENAALRERVGRAEAERDAAIQAAVTARSDAARFAADLEALRSAPWYERLGWWKRRLDRVTGAAPDDP